MKTLNLALFAAVLGCLAAGCGSVQPRTGPEASAGSGRTFSLRVLPESFATGGSARFSFSVLEDSAGALLSIRAETATELSHAYCEISYDSSRWSPVEAHSAGLLGDDVISLLAGNGRGIVQYGELIPGADPRGLDASGLLATIRFSAGPELPRSPAADHREAPLITRNASWDILSWYYSNKGDYDQNGEVNIADLTPLGVNLNTSGPFPEAGALSMVDGDGNGEINLSDITPIGVNFGQRVDGYTLYASPDGAGHPADFHDANGPGARSVATFDFADAEGGGSQRKHFRFTDTGVELHDRYWLRYGTDGAGAAGPLSGAWQKDWQRTVIYSQSKVPSGHPPALAVVAGRPCVLFGTGSADDEVALFSRAEDKLGNSWGPALKVSGDNTGVQDLHMIDNGGSAVIAFRSAVNSTSFLRQATTETGDGWFDQLAYIAGDFDTVDLLLLDGNVTVVAHDAAQAAAFIRAPDGVSINGYALGLMSDLSVVPRSGGIELCYRNLDKSYHGNMVFDGFTFEYTSSTLLSSNLNLDDCPVSFDFGGQLNMLLYDDLLGRYWLVQGTGGNSDIFTTPVQILEDQVRSLSYCQSLDRVWLAYWDNATATLRCQYSAAGDLGSLMPATDVDAGDNLLFEPGMAEINGHPAVVFFNENSFNDFDLVLARYI